MPGLVAEYFKTSSNQRLLADINFDALPVMTEIVDEVDNAKGRDPFWDGGERDYFAARYTGSLQIENPGRYTFYLNSDDGSALFLNGSRVIDNDGAHATRLRQVTLDLDAGSHPLELLYFEIAGHQTLQLEWKGPDSGGIRQTINGDALIHEASQDGTAPDNPVSPGPHQILVAGQPYNLVDHDRASQGIATAEINKDGAGLTISDNGWKAVMGEFIISEDTVLTFKFLADVIGEIHGIGFATGDKAASETFFQLSGSQSWGLESADWEYVPD